MEGFNPTLVRLRRSGRIESIGWGFLFQSHAGSIEAGERAGLQYAGNVVSIPRWFD